MGSHYHFIEANAYLSFDRKAAYGRRLNILAGPTNTPTWLAVYIIYLCKSVSCCRWKACVRQFVVPSSTPLMPCPCLPSVLGTAVRFEPGDSKTVELVEIAGNRVISGGNNVASGPVDPTRVDTIVQQLQMRGAWAVNETYSWRSRDYMYRQYVLSSCQMASRDLCEPSLSLFRLPSRGEQRGRGQASTCGGRRQQ